MKKTLKNILCILLCLSTLFAFAGCETAADREAAARTAADNFLSALCALDMQTASTYTVEGEAFLADLEFKDIEGVKTILKNAMLEGAGTEFSPYADKFNPLIDLVTEGLKNSFSYEITSATIDGDGYLVSGTLKHLDFDADMEEVFNIDETTLNGILTRVATTVMESGQLTAQTSQEEMLAMMIDPLVAELSPIISEKLTNAPSTTDDISLTVEKVAGKWLVNDADSSVDDMGFLDLM